MRSVTKRWITFLSAVLAMTLYLSAQGPGQFMPNYPFSSFRFNFINPGSRATGMGQAFIALSDDATGSETNPAGLTALLTPQAFAEGRVVANTFRWLAPADEEIRYADLVERTFSPTFLSFVYPFKNWAFAVYRQELANYSVRMHQPTVVIPGVHYLFYDTPFQIFEFSTEIDIQVTNYGVSVGRRWGERVNVGVSFRATRYAYTSLETQSSSLLSQGYYVPSGETKAILMHTNGVDWKMSWVGGFILKPLDWLKVGGVYRSGAAHDFSPVFDENIYVMVAGVPHPIRTEIPRFQLPIPDRYGIGIAVRPNDRLTFSADVVRIEYGDMTNQFVSYIQTEFQDDYEFSNGSEFHLGGEYTFFLKNVPVSLRGGFYTDPDNTLHFVGDPVRNDVIYVSPSNPWPIGTFFDDFPRAQGALFPSSGTDYHKTFGVGLTWEGHLQTDFAADLSRDTDYFVVSVLYNF